MGLVHVDPDSDYMQLIAPILAAKAELAADAWVGWLPDTRTGQLACDLASEIYAALGDPEVRPEFNLHHLRRAVFSGFAASMLEPSFAKRFRGMSEVELDRLLQAFSLKNCRPHADLVQVLQKYFDPPLAESHDDASGEDRERAA